MAAKAGRLCRIKLSGTAVAMTAEATTGTGNLTYQITDTAKRVLHPSAAVVVYDGGVETIESYTVNRLTGTITFGSAVARVITIDADYLPMSTVAEAKSFSIGSKALNVEDTVFGDLAATRVQIETDCGGSLSQIRTTDTALLDAYDAQDVVCLEFSTDSGSSLIAKAWALLSEFGTTGAKKTLQEESVSWEGSADADGRSITWL